MHMLYPSWISQYAIFHRGQSKHIFKNVSVFLLACHELSSQFLIGTPGFSTKITYREHLEYFLYGAMIYMVLKDWKKALHFLTVVMSCPVVNSVSMIMVEAYKKWILINLLERGKVSLPNLILGYRWLKWCFITASPSPGKHVFIRNESLSIIGKTLCCTSRGIWKW